MKRFQDLEIPCTENQAREFLILVEEIVFDCNGWEVNRKAMDHSIDTFIFREGLFLYINRLDDDGSPYAMVAFLFAAAGESRSEDCLLVSNIVPSQVSQLSFTDYNTVLNEFRVQILEPGLKRMPMNIRMRSEDFGMDDIFPPDCADRLRRFSHLANKSGLHPLDEDRWRAFVICVHQTHTEIYADILRRILIEELDWPEDQAHELAVRYENEIPLLEDYDEVIGCR